MLLEEILIKNDICDKIIETFGLCEITISYYVQSNQNSHSKREILHFRSVQNEFVNLLSH